MFRRDWGRTFSDRWTGWEEHGRCDRVTSDWVVAEARVCLSFSIASLFHSELAETRAVVLAQYHVSGTQIGGMAWPKGRRMLS